MRPSLGSITLTASMSRCFISAKNLATAAFSSPAAIIFFRILIVAAMSVSLRADFGNALSKPSIVFIEAKNNLPTFPVALSIARASPVVNTTTFLGVDDVNRALGVLGFLATASAVLGATWGVNGPTASPSTWTTAVTGPLLPSGAITG